MRTLIFLAVLGFSPVTHAQTLEDLHWLKGCWRSVGDGPVITEVWSAPPMPALVGYSYTTRDGQLRDWEQARIETREDGLYFVAMPRGGAGVRFRWIDVIGVDDVPENFVVFENAAHDYPQRIRYERDGNLLTAAISKIDGSDEITFTYRRISCAANLRP